MIKDKKYFYNVRAVPDDNSVFWRRDRGRYLSRYNFVANHANNFRVLDIACGVGYGSNLLVEKGALHVIGADVAEDAVEFAREHYKSPNIEFMIMNATDMSDIKDNTIDIVCSMGTIEHVENVEMFFKEIKRVLVPGGKFFVSTLNKHLRNSDELIEHHHQEYTPEEFSDILKSQFNEVVIYGHKLNDDGCIKSEKNRRFTWVPLWVKRSIDRFSLGQIVRQMIKKHDKALEISDYQWVTSNIKTTCSEVIAVCSKPII